MVLKVAPKSTYNHAPTASSDPIPIDLADARMCFTSLRQSLSVFAFSNIMLTLMILAKAVYDSLTEEILSLKDLRAAV